MQARQNRRKAPTPIVNRRNEDAWDRELEAMGLQPLSSNHRPATAASPGLSSGSGPGAAAPAVALKAQKTTIFDLPLETQKGIFEHCPPADLLSLSLVSKHFRDIAAEHLYRSFHIIFPTGDGDTVSEPPIDALASGLDTFVASDYDYGRYLREIILEPSSGGELAEHAYRNYLSDVSCGKFMNTLLLLTLRKAKALETFKWDIRVEPSRQIFKALHSIRALQHLHIRLHSGQSLYHARPSLTPPPPQPINVSTNGHSHPHPHFVAFSPINALPVAHPQPTVEFYYPGTGGNQFAAGSNLASRIHKGPKSALPTTRPASPTLSGFRNLKSLAVIDMDTLDYVTEIRDCIKHSSSTLKKLQLSFSELLASKSRKPPPELHSDDESDQEDDFTQLVPPPPGAVSGTTISSANDAPTKALKALEEKKLQEAVLARIFGLDKTIAQPPPPAAPEPEKKPAEDPRKLFMRNLAPLGKLLLKIVKDEDEQSELGKEALNVITKASKLYMEAVEGPVSTTTSGTGNASSSSTAKEPPAPTTPSAGDEPPTTEATDRGLFDQAEANGKPETQVDADVSNPDDIDVETPELPELTPGSEPFTPESQQSASEAAEDTETETAPADESINTAEVDTARPAGENASLSQLLDHYTKEKARLNQRIEDEMEEWEKAQLVQDGGLAVRGKMSASMQRSLDDLLRLDKEYKSKLSGTPSSNTARTAAMMNEYVRSTRGLTLHTLAIYLIPIRASVLFRAIDIHVLQDITLLDVGPQGSFWAIASKENKVSPLPLRKIYTDNVTLHLVAFVNQLDRVDELILLERKHNTLAEATTAKTMITMEQIRRGILKKHASTLRVLALQNDDTSDWDLNVKSAILLCQRAKALEELAVSFGTRTMHTLLQFMPGLTSLRALHTLQFRHEDTCVWVVREFRKFTVDAVSHNPEMKLEYLALDDAVERLVRRTPKKVDKKGKGKEKPTGKKGKSLAELALFQNSNPSSNMVGSSLLKLGIGPTLSIDWGNSDDEDLDVGGKMGLRVETIEDIHFSDIPGVRIFEKDVLCRRL